VNRQKYKILLFVSISLLICLIAFFIYNFSGFTISKNISDWGNFGSYIAGTIGIILTLSNLIFLYLTFREQQLLNNQQNFETTFFNLLSNHRAIVSDASDNTNKIDYFQESKLAVNLTGYKLLDYYRVFEEARMDNFLKIILATGEVFIGCEVKPILNYNAFDNRILKSKDYLISISNNILEIYSYIKLSNSIDENQRQFYRNTFLRSLKRSEKFFVLLLYIQKNSPLTDNATLTKDDIKLICDEKNKFTEYLHVTLNPNFPHNYPFCVCGLTNDATSFYPNIQFVSDEKKFPYIPAYYQISKINQDIEIERIRCNSNFNSKPFNKDYLENITGVGSNIEMSNVLLDLINLHQHFQYNNNSEILSYLKPILEKNENNIQIFIAIELILKDKPDKKFIIVDEIVYKFVNNNITVTCSPCLSLPEKFLHKSFGKDIKYLEPKYPRSDI
jgi:hypothetical protein